METKQKTLRALVYRPGEAATLEEVEGFEGFQRLCGGHVERIVLDWGPKGGNRHLQLWCNEDGISQGLPVNLYAEGPSYTGAPIFGTAVLAAACRVVDDEGDSDEEDLGLTDEEIARWASAFKRATQPPVPRGGR